MEKLAQALKNRGFLIREESDHIYFSKGNLDTDLVMLQRVFNNLGCSITVEERRIYINEELKDKQLYDITWYPAQNHEAGGGPGWRTWKYFSKRNHGPKINTFALETGVALLVKALSAAGIVTIYSCNGHSRNAPVVGFCGRQNAIWFDILFCEIKDSLSLNYDWKLEDRDSVDPSLTSSSLAGRWDLKKVLEDTNKIADYFLRNAQDISNLKREIFGKQLKSTRKLVREMDGSQLYGWMENKYKNLK